MGQLGLEAWRRRGRSSTWAPTGWTRDEAVAFLLANTPLSETQARIEADRCARMPGQAIIYTIGKRAIEDARARAQEALGEGFDPRAFHEQVLGYGPPPVLDEVIDRWIAEQTAEG